MKILIRGLYLMFFITTLSGLRAQRPAAVKKVVFIIVDGIAEDMLDSTATPSLDRIAKDGVKLSAYVGGEKGGYSQTPTISAVGYNSLLTGTWYNKHNVSDNYNQHPNYHYPTIFRLFKDQFPQKKTAIFSTWEDNRTVLIGEDKPETHFLKLDYSFDGLEKDTLNFPSDDRANNFKLIDYLVAEKAADYIAENGPDLSWVYLQHTDDVAHRYGDSKILYTNITFEDRLIGRIYDAVLKREKADTEDWLFIVTTDHGRTKNGKGHGGQSDRERNTWVVINKKLINDYARQNRVGIVDIAPTVLDFLNVNIPVPVREEMDGTGLLEPADAWNLKGTIEKGTLRITWTPDDSAESNADIYITNNNHFKEGGSDAYRLLARPWLSSGKFEMKLKESRSSDFFKVVLRTKNNTLNTWITPVSPKGSAKQ